MRGAIVGAAGSKAKAAEGKSASAKGKEAAAKADAPAESKLEAKFATQKRKGVQVSEQGYSQPRVTRRTRGANS